MERCGVSAPHRAFSRREWGASRQLPAQRSTGPSAPRPCGGVSRPSSLAQLSSWRASSSSCSHYSGSRRTGLPSNFTSTENPVVGEFASKPPCPPGGYRKEAAALSNGRHSKNPIRRAASANDRPAQPRRSRPPACCAQKKRSPDSLRASRCVALVVVRWGPTPNGPPGPGPRTREPTRGPPARAYGSGSSSTRSGCDRCHPPEM